MNIEDLTLKQLRDIQSIFGAAEKSKQHPFEIGKNYIVRTVTMIYTGKLVDVTDQELIMTSVSWIPETERYMQFVAEGKVKECEPYPDHLRVAIGRGALMDAVILEKELPRSQK